MLQKIILMLCFSIGTLSLSSCGNKTVEPPIRTGTYVYINKSNQDIEMEVPSNSYTSKRIQKGDSTTFTSSGELPFPYFGGYGGIDEYVIIKFADGNCTKYKYFGTGDGEQIKSGGVYNLKEYNNYSKELVNRRAYTLRYTIDSTDYKKATPCK